MVNYAGPLALTIALLRCLRVLAISDLLVWFGLVWLMLPVPRKPTRVHPETLSRTLVLLGQHYPHNY